MIVSLIYYNIEFPLFALGYLDPFGEANAFFLIFYFSLLVEFLQVLYLESLSYQ